MHLLDLADEAVFGGAPGRNQGRPKALERQAGPVLLVAAARTDNALLAHQVALFADGIPERRLQLGRVHNPQVQGVDDLGTCDVELAGPVASFAADRVAPEDWRPITVDRAGH